jgi:hypothetical protein
VETMQDIHPHACQGGGLVFIGYMTLDEETGEELAEVMRGGEWWKNAGVTLAGARRGVLTGGSISMRPENRKLGGFARLVHRLLHR